jgi:HEPN domain-containing protein
MNSASKQFIIQWVNKANEDILVVNKLTEFDIIANSAVCFHCQQAVEKFLKAFLFAHDKDVKKTHNIEYHISECAEIDPAYAEIDPKNLSDFGVEARYPGDMYTPSNKETLEYKSIAETVKNQVENSLKSILTSESL